MPKAKNQSRRVYILVMGVSAAVFCFFFLKKEEWGISVVFASFPKRRFLGILVLLNHNIFLTKFIYNDNPFLIMDWKLFAWLKRGRRRQSVLEVLSESNKPLSTNEIKVKLKVAISQASFTLKELVEKKLISSVNPDDNIGKLYIITDLGKKVLEELK